VKLKVDVQHVSNKGSLTNQRVYSYASELAKAAEASDTTALIGGNLSGLQLDQEGHRTVMPIAAKANNDGLGWVHCPYDEQFC